MSMKQIVPRGSARATGARPQRRPVSAPPSAARRGASAEPGIVDAVRDQHGDTWILYGTSEKSTWFAVGALIDEQRAVFRRLSAVASPLLTTATQTAFKQVIEAHAEYREALVAARPGWIENHFVFGDGTVGSPESDRREVIVTFDPNPKFTGSGSLGDWQRAVAPFVIGQPLPLFVVALSLAGPLLRFLPRGYHNPMVEIVGPGEVGKSSLATLAASVWAGDPENDCGGGESWGLTLNAIDDIKRMHRDCFAFLDEGNLAGGTLAARREFMKQAVFILAGTGAKRRMGDPTISDHVRLAVLSTTNTAIADLIEDTADVRGAAQSRIITLRIGADLPHGVFSSVPLGYVSARAATEAMRKAADFCWGAAGRAFVAKLVWQAEQNEGLLRRYVENRLNRFMSLHSQPGSSARLQKAFALVAVAAELGQRWNIIPPGWGLPSDMVREVARSVYVGPIEAAGRPLDRVRAYVQRHHDRLLDADDLGHPLSRAAFDGTPGFLSRSDGCTELLVPANLFQHAFPDYATLMRALRDRGQAKTESGSQPKLTTKVPSRICREGRVYRIMIEWSCKGSSKPSPSTAMPGTAA